MRARESRGQTQSSVTWCSPEGRASVLTCKRGISISVLSADPRPRGGEERVGCSGFKTLVSEPRASSKPVRGAPAKAERRCPESQSWAAGRMGQPLQGQQI